MLIHKLQSYSSLIKAVYDPKAFILHAALLRQGFPHCGIFLTAASRRSLGRVSVPVWLIILSNQLMIVGLVSHYLTNYLIIRRPFPKRINPLIRRPYAVLATLSGGYPSLWGMFPRVTQPSAARHHFSLFPPLSSFVLDMGFPLEISASRLEREKQIVRSMLPLDLHVLSTPPAFILSQDQTLHKFVSKTQTTQLKLTINLHNQIVKDLLSNLLHNIT